MSSQRRVRIPPNATEEFFAGGDLSLTATGFVIMNQWGEVKERHVIKPKTKGAQRLCEIQAAIRKIITPYPIKLTCLEGYARGKLNGREEAGEINGVVQILLYRMGIPYRHIAPTTLKRFATGSGKSEKDQVMMYVFKFWNFQAVDNNEADAAALCRIALSINGYGGNLNPEQRNTLQTILNPPAKKKKKKNEEE